ncbi:MAG: MFS transporter [Ardenticatenaceae bacterium]|nr:MFS transporter [Ardenticatenaceae bacterium]
MTGLSWRPNTRPIPREYRANFLHLYLDIAWYAVLSGSAIAFVSVFVTRQGANEFQLGLLNAGPAVVNLMATLPASQWLQARPINRGVFWTAVFNRIVYFSWVFLPSFLLPSTQVWSIILLTLLMSIPGAALAIGFNALFASAVPIEWRSHVAGVRNALLAIVYIIISLLSGWLLDYLPFPLGYQVVFGIGFLGAVMSTVHLWYVRPSTDPNNAPQQRPRNLASPGIFRTGGDSTRQTIGLRFLTKLQNWQQLLRPDIWRQKYGQILLALFTFHLTQYLAIPLFPLFWVNHLHLTDQQIGYGTALFYLTVLIGSTQLVRLTNRYGNHRILFAGALFMSAYPALTAVTHALPLYLITSMVGGFAWSLVGGVIANYLLEKIPGEERPLYLAWYNLILNAAILLGSFIGPALAAQFGLVITLFLAAIGRLFAALHIWRRG